MNAEECAATVVNTRSGDEIFTQPIAGDVYSWLSVVINVTHFIADDGRFIALATTSYVPTPKTTLGCMKH